MNANYKIERGKDGEALARRFLEKRDYEIIFCNWRYKRFEIDIVSLKDEIVHFVEVKTRHSIKYGLPEDAVTRKKFDCLKNAAVAFQNRYPFVKRIQFDILSILILEGKEIEYFLIEDVYM